MSLTLCVTVRAVKMLFSVDMLLLSVVFIYTGEAVVLDSLPIDNHVLQNLMQGMSSTFGVVYMDL